MIGEGVSEPAPGPPLSELLGELVSGGDAVGAQERLDGLLDAVLAVASDLSLPAVLERIVESACRLLDARYGAMGVIGSDGLLERFVNRGIPAADHRLIGELPHGRGVLGVLLDDPRPIRLHEISEHPSSYGFPPHHPPMHSFIGVPVRTRDRIYGNLYLTEKSGGRDFSAEDEALAVALAAAAGVAIDNARLYAAERRRQAWLVAAMDVRRHLVDDAGTPADDPDAALDLVARTAAEVAGTDVAVVMDPVPDRHGRHGRHGWTVRSASDGRGALPVADGGLRGRTLDLSPPPRGDQPSLRTGVRLIDEDDTEEGDDDADALRVPALVVSLLAGEQHLRLLIIGGPARQATEADAELAMVSTFALHAAMSLQLRSALDDRARLAVLEDRDRIARDLHDVVIQRLFATGLSLQSLTRWVDGEPGRGRIGTLVEALDDTIRDVRTAIFSLQDGPPSGGLRSGLLHVCAASSAALGFEPRLHFDGPLDAVVPQSIGRHLTAVLGESLANVARHADASGVQVTVGTAGGLLHLEVRDDGRGGAERERSSGLANMRRRAEELGGRLVLHSPPGEGTRVRWEVPLG